MKVLQLLLLLLLQLPSESAKGDARIELRDVEAWKETGVLGERMNENAR